MVARWLGFLFKLAIIIAVAVFFINLWLENKDYLFDKESLAEIAKKYAGMLFSVTTNYNLLARNLDGSFVKFAKDRGFISV